MNPSSVGHASAQDLKSSLDRLQQLTQQRYEAYAQAICVSFCILKAIVPNVFAVSPEVEADFDDSGNRAERLRGIWLESNTCAGYDVPGLAVVSRQALIVGDRQTRDFYGASPQPGERLVDAVIRRVGNDLGINDVQARSLMATADFLVQLITCRHEIGSLARDTARDTGNDAPTQTS
ncbi:hypothetical protein [Ahniella affigens]|uniref:hypothetical protein n=1 Tax=Ahniella affigens TaxID=2021234 RepID=UPI0011B24AFA|nr:hypothetical protein [Ahniella affigens]